jgi:hypothetical protein
MHEWLKDTLPATATAGGIEGDDFGFASYGSQTTLTRVTNTTQIFRRDVAVTETQRAVNPAGFKDAYAYEVSKAVKAIGRNIETVLWGTQTSATALSGTRRQMRSFQDKIFMITAATTPEPNINTVSLGVPVASGAVMSEFNFNSLLELVYTNGGNPELCFVSPAVKRMISGFHTKATYGMSASLAINTVNIDASQKKLIAAVDFYDSDFGLIQIILDRWVPQAADGSSTDYTGVAFFLERAKNRLAWLRPVQHTVIGKRGDSVAGIIVGEVTLEVLNESCNGYIRGILNPSV